MKKISLLFTIIFLATGPAIAQKIPNEELCNASDACKKVCKLQGVKGALDQNLINQCSIDITKKFNLD